ncbi:MAG: hypothetical protein GY696_11695 [Gammaproteobacteria bacterium]|nr:hypothetical protein [Gammaproteobacteria bacterium]
MESDHCIPRLILRNPAKECKILQKKLQYVVRTSMLHNNGRSDNQRRRQRGPPAVGTPPQAPVGGYHPRPPPEPGLGAPTPCVHDSIKTAGVVRREAHRAKLDSEKFGDEAARPNRWLILT